MFRRDVCDKPGRPCNSLHTSIALRMMTPRWTCCASTLIACVHAAVARIALVKPDKARGVENMILQAAQRGNISEKARVPPGCALACASPMRARAMCDRREPKGGHLRTSLILAQASAAQVSEQQLVDMLGRISESAAGKTKITMHRRRAFDDD